MVKGLCSYFGIELSIVLAHASQKKKKKEEQGEKKGEDQKLHIRAFTVAEKYTPSDHCV